MVYVVAWCYAENFLEYVKNCEDRNTASCYGNDELLYFVSEC
jgi:hypothetical protein